MSVYLRICTYVSRLCTFMDKYLAGGLIPVLRQPSRDESARREITIHFAILVGGTGRTESIAAFAGRVAHLWRAATRVRVPLPVPRGSCARQDKPNVPMPRKRRSSTRSTQPVVCSCSTGCRKQPQRPRRPRVPTRYPTRSSYFVTDGHCTPESLQIAWGSRHKCPRKGGWRCRRGSGSFSSTVVMGYARSAETFRGASRRVLGLSILGYFCVFGPFAYLRIASFPKIPTQDLLALSRLSCS